jgi:hypothetical protein
MRKGPFIVGLFLSSCSHPPTTAERFTGPWLKGSPQVMMLLLKHQAEGCGKVYMKVAKNSPADPAFKDYLLYCTDDGKNWTAWEVWPGSDQVLGPGAPVVGIALPDRSKISK